MNLCVCVCVGGGGGVDSQAVYFPRKIFFSENRRLAMGGGLHEYVCVTLEIILFSPLVHGVSYIILCCISEKLRTTTLLVTTLTLHEGDGESSEVYRCS